MSVVAGLAHHSDDLFHGRRVGGIEPSLVAGRTSGVVAGHGRGRATPTGGIEHWRDGHGISSQSHSGTQSPPPYRRSRILASGITSRSRSSSSDRSGTRRLARHPALAQDGRLAVRRRDGRIVDRSLALAKGAPRSPGDAQDHRGDGQAPSRASSKGPRERGLLVGSRIKVQLSPAACTTRTSQCAPRTIRPLTVPSACGTLPRCLATTMTSAPVCCAAARISVVGSPTGANMSPRCRERRAAAALRRAAAIAGCVARPAARSGFPIPVPASRSPQSRGHRDGRSRRRGRAHVAQPRSRRKPRASVSPLSAVHSPPARRRLVSARLDEYDQRARRALRRAYPTPSHPDARGPRSTGRALVEAGLR